MKKWIKKKKIFIILAAAVVLILLLWLVRTRVTVHDGFFRITMIDVGKGDCFLVQTGDADDPDNVLIDTGYKDTAKEVKSYLMEHGIYRLDAVIISHFHKDHVGGAAKILKSSDIQVSKVYMPDYEGHREVYYDMMDVLKSPDCTTAYERLDSDTEFRLNNAVYKLYPSDIVFDGDNDNDCSLAAVLEYEGQKALFTGDLQEEGIKRLLKNHDIRDVNILKLPYHGAAEENSESLLKIMKKDGIAIATDGLERRASGALAEKIKRSGFNYISAADDGTVVITYDAERHTYDIRKTSGQEIVIEEDWKDAA